MIREVKVGGNCQTGSDDLQQKVKPDGATVDEAIASLKVDQNEKDNIRDQINAGGENFRLRDGSIVLAYQIAEIGNLAGWDDAIKGNDEWLDVVEATQLQWLPLAVGVLVDEVRNIQEEEEGRKPGECRVGKAWREGWCCRVPGDGCVLVG